MMVSVVVVVKMMVVVNMMGVNTSVDHDALLRVMRQRRVLLRKMRLVWRNSPRSLCLLEVI